MNEEPLTRDHHYCFSNETDVNDKTMIYICADLDVDGDNNKKNLNETKMLLNIIGKY